MKKPYEAPSIRELGSLAELTAQPFNKSGSSPDHFASHPGMSGSMFG